MALPILPLLLFAMFFRLKGIQYADVRTGDLPSAGLVNRIRDLFAASWSPVAVRVSRWDAPTPVGPGAVLRRAAPRRADRSLYPAKHAGRNRVSVDQEVELTERCPLS